MIYIYNMVDYGDSNTTFIISLTVVEPCTSIFCVLVPVGDASCKVCGVTSLGSLQPT